MNYGKIKEIDVANGTGCRVSLFVSGCRNHCRGCFNPETWNFDYGEEFTDETERDIFQLLDRPFIRGLSVLGGDPFERENVSRLVPFLRRVKERFPASDIWVYTGYLYELIKRDDRAEMLKYIDVLVDGQFVIEQRDLKLRFRGSSNQRIIDVQASSKKGGVVLWEG